MAGPYRTRYWEVGEGRPVLLVHGLGTSAELWGANVGALGQRFRALVPDLPGFGLTDKPADGYTLANAARFLADFLAARDVTRASVVGNSMGGLLAAHFALEYPQMVDRLVLVDAAGLGREVCLLLRLFTVPGLGEVMAFPTRAALRWVLGSLFYDRTHLPDYLVEAVYHHRRSPAARRALLRVTRYGLDLRGQKRHILLMHRLPSLKVPTLIVWGKQDRVIPYSHGHAAHQTASHSRLHLFDRCGHVPMLECPAEFNGLVTDFLSA